MTLLQEDRLLPSDPGTRAVARRLYRSIRDLPIVSPHGHANPRWFAEDEPFPNAAQLFVVPDHYISRMLYSQGVPLEELYINDARNVWRIFAHHYYLFRATPTRLWLDFAFHSLFGLDKRLTPENADEYYDTITEKLKEPGFRPRALFERFRLEVLATTDSPLDSLSHHVTIRESSFKGRIIPTFRPDPVVDPDSANFKENIARLGQMTGADTGSWQGYLSALRQRRSEFIALGCKATDHGHSTAATADLDRDSAARLYQKILSGAGDPEDRELFRAQMLTEMAAMSLDDKMVMQIHPGSFRNHNTSVFRRFGPDAGADIPTPTNYVQALKPLLNRFGYETGLTIILFTLDESTYSRELAPLAGHYPCLRLGPAWWFHDSPEGIMRFREHTTETAGFYNTVGFNDDSRSFISIPARHDVARRVDCSFLARLVVEHQLDEGEAFEVAAELAGGLARKAYRL
jgi:glucuronate isomerase